MAKSLPNGRENGCQWDVPRKVEREKLQQTHTASPSDAAVMILFLVLTPFHHHHHSQWGCVPWVVQTNWNCAVPYESCIILAGAGAEYREKGS